jgi:lipopolysaccharide biosynthesis protein
MIETRVDSYVIDYLSALHKVDVDIIFITATTPEGELEKVCSLVRRILVKNDAGRDFGSWSLALRTLGVDLGRNYDRVIFANDSIYFPVRPIAPLFADMELKNYNLYGLIDSRDVNGYHIQSFFLAFDRKAQEKVFPEFLHRFEHHYVLTKWGQIREFEVGITEIARAAGLSVGAFVSIDQIQEDVIRDPKLQGWYASVRHGLRDINPTHDLWDLVVGEYSFCGVKVELLRDNPKHARGFEKLPQLIADGEVPIEHIFDHQARIKGAWIRPIAAAQGPKTEPIFLRQRITGQGPSEARRLVLFAHYDSEGVVDPHVVRQIAALARSDCAVAVITAADDAGELKKLIPFARDILVKNDVGRDFGSWYLAIRELYDDFVHYGSIIWMNDSTYFPLFDPTKLFWKMDQADYDLWGIVDSHNLNWHIMSWFWSIGPRAIKQGWFNWYLGEYNSSYTKWAQINNYEMRIPRLIKESGLRTGAFINAREVEAYIIRECPGHARFEAARRGDSSVTQDFWEEIITQFHCPALKVELLRDNPLGIDLSNVLRVIRDHTEYDPELIRGHMLRLKAKHLHPPTRTELGYPE